MAKKKSRVRRRKSNKKVRKKSKRKARRKRAKKFVPIKSLLYTIGTLAICVGLFYLIYGPSIKDETWNFKKISNALEERFQQLELKHRDIPWFTKSSNPKSSVPSSLIKKPRQESKAPAKAITIIRPDPTQSRVGADTSKTVPVLHKQRLLHPTKPKLVFVIDDIGYNLNYEPQLRTLGHDVTYAILPLLPYSRYFGNLAAQTKAEVILHLPLETINGTIPGRGLILGRMSQGDILDLLNTNLNSVPNHSGVNNHMGSKGTADPYVMETILQDLKRRGLFYLDSQTTQKSVASTIASKMNLSFLKRDVFLDNIDELGAIEKQLNKLLSVATRQGYGIGIGHYRYNTLKLLHEKMPQLKNNGFEVITLSDLIEWKKDKKL